MGDAILIVDDEKSLVHVLRQTLELQFPEARIDTAYSGEEGMSCLAERPYDLIIADLRMPGFDGLELIKGVRYLDGEMPIILVTGYGSTELRSEARRLGVDYYFDKPFNVTELLSAAEELLVGGVGENG